MLRGSCKRCERKRLRDARARDTQSFEGLARTLIRSKLIRARHLSKFAKTKEEKRLSKFDLDPAWFVSQWKQQNGRCFYTKVPLSKESGPYKISIDRVDSSIGYLQDNCVLACLAVNIMKNQAEVEEFVWWCRKVSRGCRVKPRPPTERTTNFFH